MIAYLFWHRPRPGVDHREYEARLRAFHEALEVPAWAFRLDALPFGRAGGYEDWYVVDDWAGLGALNAAAVDARRRDRHDAPARLVADGWGGVYAHVRGAPEPPASARWLTTAPDEDTPSVWRRQMVLGPAPEFCAGGGGGAGRALLWHR